MGVLEYSGSAAFALGSEYEYRLPGSNRMLGVGPVVHLALYPNMTDVAAAANFFIHPFDEFRLNFGPGLLFSNLGQRFLFRGGGAYQIHIGRYLFVPHAFADFIAVKDFDYRSKNFEYSAGLTVGVTFGE